MKMSTNVYKTLLDKLNSGEETVLLTHLQPKSQSRGSVTSKSILTREDMIENLSYSNKDNGLYEGILVALETGNIQFFNKENEEEILIEPFFPKPRLIVLGGGHIAKPLVELGYRVGFSVTVIDDRPSFANTSRFPEASRVICESFENCFEKISIGKSDFVVIVTRGHRHDETCLRQTLECNPAYIGMIGSKRRAKGIMEKLKGEGYSPEQIDKVNSPIGLDIGAVTPEEIAISIIAEVISFRRKRGNKRDSKDNTKFNWPEFDLGVIEELANGNEDQKALVTIVSAKGSVPRKSGAKMIVWPHGKILGSIGGGCSEADVITKARDIVLNGVYSIEHVDMTGDVAEDEGMVCGGTMKVLIESL